MSEAEWAVRRHMLGRCFRALSMWGARCAAFQPKQLVAAFQLAMAECSGARCSPSGSWWSCSRRAGRGWRGFRSGRRGSVGGPIRCL